MDIYRPNAKNDLFEYYERAEDYLFAGDHARLSKRAHCGDWHLSVAVAGADLVLQASDSSR